MSANAPATALSGEASAVPSSAFPARRCNHCGNRFQPRFEAEEFCCSGCRVVYEVILAGGLGTFYELLGNRVLEPATANELPQEPLEEIEEAITAAEHEATRTGHPARILLRIGNLSCTACVWLVDHLFRQHPGALRINSDTTRSTLTLYWQPGNFAALDFVKELHRHGYPASLCRPEDEEAPQESRALLTRVGVTSGLAMNTMAFTLPSYLGLETGSELSRLFTLVAFASATLALAVGGSYFFQRALSSLKARSLHMDIPISLGLIVAWIGSVAGLLLDIEGMLYFDFVAIFAFLMLTGRYLHLRLLDRNRRQLWARERETTLVRKIDATGGISRIPLARIVTGDLLEIPAGAMIPVDAVLESGDASLSLDWINGEPEPVLHQSGQHIAAGARNASADPVRVRARQDYHGSFLERLFSPLEDFTNHTAATSTHPVRKFYLVFVLVFAFAAAAFRLWLGKGPADGVQALISVLIVSCPCALGLALPLLDEMVLAKLKGCGIFVRRHTLWNRLRRIRYLDFDKTGTLTEPVKRLEDPEAIDRLDGTALTSLRQLTETNPHPVGRALREVIIARRGIGLRPIAADAISETSGQGVEFHDGTHRWRLGRGDWAADLPGEACVFSRDGQALAAFHFAEAIRDGAIAQIRELQRHGFQIRILSGDPDVARVRRTAHALGLADDQVHANLGPAEKAGQILANDPAATLYVGDGGNDGPAFDVAGVTGSPATGIRAIEGRSDFVFTGRGFHAIPHLLRAASRRTRFVHGLFALAVAYNLGAIALCFAGLMSPLLAAILMPLSSLVTTTIASRV